MTTTSPPAGAFSTQPLQLRSASGLCVQINANGSIRRMDHGDILLNLFPGNEMEGGPANLYLRRHGAGIEAIPLLGPNSPARIGVEGNRLFLAGEWRDLRFRVVLVLADSAPAWFWHVSLENIGGETVTADLIHLQDVGLAHYWAVRLNEYYVSQYVDHTPLDHPCRGTVLAARQNQAMGGRHPWLLMGCLGRGVAHATDALQVYGLTRADAGIPAAIPAGLPGTRHQHEHSLAALQDEPVKLAPGMRTERGFFGWFETHHPAATRTDDLEFVARALALPEALPPGVNFGAAGVPAATTLFGPARLLRALDPEGDDLAAWFGAAGEKRMDEEWDGGRLLSFFLDGSRHVVLRAKEGRVLRPHGHILRSGGAWIPDEASLTSTVWMAGVFQSMLTQGHVNINRFLSTQRGYLGLFRSQGQRIFVELEEGFHLLDQPSAFEMAPDGCRWLYRHAGGVIEIRALAGADRHAMRTDIRVLEGPARRFLLSHHLAIGGDDGAEALPLAWSRDQDGLLVRTLPDTELGWRFPDGGFRIAPTPATPICSIGERIGGDELLSTVYSIGERIGGDELLFADGRSRGQPFLCLLTAATAEAGVSIRGCLVAGEATPRAAEGATTAGLVLQPPASGPHSAALSRLGRILPWFAHDALIHYLAPRGLEQFSGGGWGSRDVTQGSMEMLLALGRFEPIRDLLLRVFRMQNPDGDWPQWFMFFERERNIRPGDSHGDIVFWPLLALAHYLSASGDAGLLDEPVPFFHPDGDGQAQWAPLRAHLERALAVIAARRIAGTGLAAYGHGDWNDSLQPVDPAMRERLCSTWTVTLHFQTLRALADAHRSLGLEAGEFEREAGHVLQEFQSRLLVDGVLAGFAHFHPDGKVDYLVHPRDRDSGIHYSLLPMIHAIVNDMLTPEQAERHLALIREHLLGPDGARLFDRPLPYRGGPQRYFQRAESSSYFGREIGLMYTHAHLRHAEALARVGDAEGFFRALCLANPIALRALVPSAAPRQANCYFSSSDAAFADRYQALAEYGRALRGEIPLEGGWRIYSSGAGIAVRMIFQCLLGLRREHARLVFDPVLPSGLDGLRVELEFAGQPLQVAYHIGARGHGPEALRLNGHPLAFERLANPYRTGGAAVSMEAWTERLAATGNCLDLWLG